jgi:asparagine N-glycosylation enzyme membrane subunit Stt3
VVEEIGVESVVSSMEKETSVSEKDIEKRKKQIVNFFKKSGSWIYYAILSFILFISVYIRTRNISKLKDITTGTWTLGPDLDPFLFLRWAQSIVDNGKLFVLDTMRSVPLASICSGAACGPVNTYGEARLLSYMIAWFSRFLSFFNKETTVTYAAIIFPVVMAVFTGIAFFFFARKLFYKEDKKIANIIALISTALFVLIPSLLPRTIAGIPEKESAAFFFIFLAFYFFLEAYTSEKIKRGVIYSILAGISTAILGLISGEVIFVFLGIAGAVLLAFLLDKINGKRVLFYSLWIFISIVFVMPFSTRFDLSSLANSTSTGLDLMVFFVLIMDFLIFKKKIFKLDHKIKSKIKFPQPVISLIITGVILVILSSIAFGISFIPSVVQDIISHTITPFVPTRFGVTVAENAQPYFVSDWISNFGPVLLGIPIYFWLFFVGSVFLFNHMIKPLIKKEKIILTSSYIIFLLGLIFSKYSSSSVLNGQSGLSLFIYSGGILAFLISFVYVYYKRYKEEKFSVFKEFNFAYIFYFFLLTMMIVASRGAVRLIMNLGAVSPIVIAFLAVKGFQKYIHEKEETNKIFIGIVVLLILLATIFTAWSYYKDDKTMAENFAPGIYQWQWQKAMSWVRENTSKEAVFAHWWDYGYWVQSIGERATILDGGNAVGWWNHYMGRLVLTGTNERDALDFLYAHKGTHLLIDSTDIGKYGAFSSIGSGATYDHYSWIPTVVRDETQTQETNNETMYVYSIGTLLDEDVIITTKNKTVLLPRKNAAVGAVALRKGANGEILQPTIYYVYNQQQYNMPMRYVYINDTLYDFKSGMNAGLFTFTRIDQDSTGSISIVEDGAAFYLSNRTINTELAKLYLFNEQSDYFKLVHTEDDLLIANLREQGADVGDLVYFQGSIRGPIKIWEISYPSDIELNPVYLETEYPPEFEKVISGEY